MKSGSFLPPYFYQFACETLRQLGSGCRLTGEVAERSIAGQIEFWAKLGRAVEPLRQGVQVMALSRAGAAKPLSECLDSVDSPKATAGLRFVNADVIAGELDMDAYAATRVAGALRQELVKLRESFVFETVFSDSVGDKLAFLKDAVVLSGK